MRSSAQRASGGAGRAPTIAQTAQARPASSASAWAAGSVMLAADHGFSVASVNYGALTADSERALPRACPIVGSYGARDRWPGVRKVPGILEPALTAAGIEDDIKVYAGAGHGFPNDHDPDDRSCLDKVIAKLAAAGYHEAVHSRRPHRIITFVRAHLVDAPAKA